MKELIMKSAYRLFKRGNGVYYVEHNESGQQRSLKTKDKQEAQKLFHVHNDAANGQQINFEIGMTYIKAGDPGAVLRTWQNVFDEVSARGSENTYIPNPEGRKYYVDMWRPKTLESVKNVKDLNNMKSGKL